MPIGEELRTTLTKVTTSQPLAQHRLRRAPVSRARPTATTPVPAARDRPQPRVAKHNKTFELVPCGRDGSLEKKAKFESQRQGQGQERTRPRLLLPLRRLLHHRWDLLSEDPRFPRRTWTRTSSSLWDCLPSRGGRWDSVNGPFPDIFVCLWLASSSAEVTLLFLKLTGAASLPGVPAARRSTTSTGFLDLYLS